MESQEAPASPLTAPLPRVWRFCAHPALLAILTFLLLLSGLAYWWLPQAPTSLILDPTAYNAWLERMAGTLAAGRMLGALGFLDVAHNAVVRILMALMLVTVTVRLLDRLQLALATRALAAPRQALPGLVTHDAHCQLTDPDNGWLPQLRRYFERFQSEEGEAPAPELSWTGDCHHRFTWFYGAIEAGLLLLLLALLLGLRQGWQMEDLKLLPGSSLALTPFSDQTILLDKAASNLSICCRNEASAPLQEGAVRLGGLNLDVQALIPALSLTARVDGQPLLSQSIEQGGAATSSLLLRFPQARSERTVTLPERNLLLRIVQLTSEQYRVQALDSADNLLLSEEIRGEGRLSLGDIELQLSPTRTATLRVTYRPWRWLLIPAFLLLASGLFLRWRYAYGRLGLLVTSGHVAVRWQRQRFTRPTLDEIEKLLCQ